MTDEKTCSQWGEEKKRLFIEVLDKGLFDLRETGVLVAGTDGYCNGCKQVCSGCKAKCASGCLEI